MFQQIKIAIISLSYTSIYGSQLSNSKQNLIGCGLLILATSLSFIESTKYKKDLSQYWLMQEVIKLKENIETNNVNSFIHNNTNAYIQNNELGKQPSIFEETILQESNADILLKDTIENDNSNNLQNTNIQTNIQNKKIVENNQLVVKYRKSFNHTLRSIGINNKDILLCTKAISKIIPLRSISKNTKLNITLKHSNLEKLEFNLQLYKITAIKKNGKFIVKKEKVPTKKKLKSISAPLNKIEKQLRPNLPEVKHIKKNANLQLVYEEIADLDGNLINRNILGLAAIINGQLKHIYKYNNEYLDDSGNLLNNNRKSALIRPIDSWKITSHFGVRIHPISGKIKQHTGIDLSARTGTPVKAAANGIISQAGIYSGYGKYISINHMSNLKTNYGHLSIIAVKKGQFVKQGDIIGYSGSSGTATAPHLHYEVVQNGHFINPLSYIPPTKRKLTGLELKKFKKFKNYINLQMPKPIRIR